VSTVVSVVPQRRRNRQFVALQVAPRSARPQALRDLYRDAGTIRRGESRVDEPSETVQVQAQTSR
jgi:hypothetical protein